jgi:hypothetical protein
MMRRRCTGCPQLVQYAGDRHHGGGEVQ